MWGADRVPTLQKTAKTGQKSIKTGCPFTFGIMAGSNQKGRIFSANRQIINT